MEQVPQLGRGVKRTALQHKMRSNYRKRRKRSQHSFLTEKMQAAARRFAEQAGPLEFNEKGRRDFKTWLASLRHPRCQTMWDEIASAIGRELFRHDSVTASELQEEVVREVIRYVVKPRCDECEHIISVTAYRHAASTRSNSSLRSVFESQLGCDSTDPTLGNAIREDYANQTEKSAGPKGCDDASSTRVLPSFHELASAL